jgi:membrane-bound lytic murein transglycosylase B
MSHKRLTRWQRATALVPLALLSGAWTTSLTVTSSASAAPEGEQQTLPDGTPVPDEAIEAPASLSQPGSVAPGVPDDRARGIAADASIQGIPDAALTAYRRTEDVMAGADASCRLGWQLVAAIGRVESDHGRYGGSVLGDDGVSRPGIYGIPLDGSNGTARITDTDAGRYDDDKVLDRAVGPMQFIPATWSVVGVDADGDDQRNPQDIDDAALATGVYLCAGDENLATDGGRRSAVYRYNHSQEYVDLVLSVMESYRAGDFTAVPNGAASPVVLAPDPTAQSSTPTPKRQRPSRPGGQTSSGGSTGGSGGGSGGSGGSGGQDGGTVSPPPSDEPTGPVGDGVEDTKDTVDNTIDTTAEAVSFCTAELSGITGDQAVIDKCAARIKGLTEDEAAARIPNTLAGVLDWLGMSTSLPGL